MSWLLEKLGARLKDIPRELQRELSQLEKLIGYRFKNRIFLVGALKHRSALHTLQQDRCHSNERLEFLGDAVLDLIIAEYFYNLFPNMVEGQLTQLRSIIVSGSSLVGAAEQLKLGDFVIMSENEEKAGGRNRASILEDAFEALIGAIYLDGGMKPAVDFVETHLLDNWRDIVQRDEFVNFKSLILEHAQANRWPNPEYRLIEETGPDHDKRFVVELFLNSEPQGRGEGPSKKAAEQKAASIAAQKFGLLDDRDEYPEEDSGTGDSSDSSDERRDSAN